MKSFFVDHKFRVIVPLLVGAGLILGILLGSQQDVSWAAPNQSPDQQTIPTRDPQPPEPDPTQDDDDDDDDDEVPLPEPTLETPSPTPTLEPTVEIPSPVPTLQPTDEAPSPTPSLEPEDDVGNTPVQPTQPPELEENEGQEGTPPANAAASGENEDNNLAIPQEADLSLRKTINNPRPDMGDEVAFTITVHNSGPSNATNVAVSNRLPAGLNLISGTPGQGNFNTSTGLWTISAISPDRNVNLVVVAGVTNASLMTSTAEVIAVDQFDPDSTPGNGLEDEDDQASVPLEISLETALAAQPDASQPTQFDSEMVTVPASSSASTPELSLNIFAGLNWLYVLGLGLLLFLGGAFLINRSRGPTS